jgi:YggT family protein
MIGTAFLRSGLYILIWIVEAYKWVIVVRALLTWVSPDPRNPIVRALAVLTEPALRPFRRVLSPHRTGGIDLSPVFPILILQFLEMFLKEIYHSPWRTL